MKKSENKSELEIVNDILSSSDGAVVQFLTGDNELKAIYYQDNQMKETFKIYPEVLFLDATFKTNNLRMPLYFFLCIDGNGHS